MYLKQSYLWQHIDAREVISMYQKYNRLLTYQEIRYFTEMEAKSRRYMHGIIRREK
jgi:hypothetical protein